LALNGDIADYMDEKLGNEPAPREAKESSPSSGGDYAAAMANYERKLKEYNRKKTEKHPSCKGTGRTTCAICKGSGRSATGKTYCGSCNGKGGDRCFLCKETGLKYHDLKPPEKPQRN